MADFAVAEYLADQGRVILSYPGFDFDDFNDVAALLTTQLAALVVEKQLDADLHSWLFRCEDTLFLLRAEFYSQSLWIETLSVEHSSNALARLVGRIASL